MVVDHEVRERQLDFGSGGWLRLGIVRVLDALRCNERMDELTNVYWRDFLFLLASISLMN